ncbi:MAG: hypothetical protein JSW11_03015 [Candidatus Heimdallarchaeota archaeon]|nr:MAG: hypothetical protein JSW11_03015 [Candidatus Heimdallarchaeota archaeon]
MNKQYETVDEYLDQVRMYLEPLSDKDQIIKELRAHIWDQANRLSEENSGLTIQAAFHQALLMMENPKTLADKFLEEEPSDFATDWKSPIKVPETKVKNEQFLVLAIVGFAAVIIMALAIQMISNDIAVSILAVIIGILAIGMFTFGLYLSDERLFQEQLDRFREMFQKPKSSQKAMEASSVSFIREKPVTKEVGFWSAFGEHLGGFLGGVFITFVIAFIFLLEQMPFFNLPLFNENWYPIGALATYGALLAGLAYCIFLVVFGRIRVTRLASAGRNIIGFICAVILIWYYPFTLELAILAQNIPEVMTNSDLLFLVGRSDLFLRLIIGISGIISGISALYDIFKFGAWQPSDRKSLI